MSIVRLYVFQYHCVDILGEETFQTGINFGSLRANSTNSLKENEVPSPVESTNQRHKACPKSRVVPRLEEPKISLVDRDFYCSLLVKLIDRHLQGMVVIILIELNSIGQPTLGLRIR